MKTILVYKVLKAKFRINSAKERLLSVNGENGSTAQGHKGAKA
jgi:hypothetical protein